MPFCLLPLWQFLFKFIGSFMLQLLNRLDQWPSITVIFCLLACGDLTGCSFMMFITDGLQVSYQSPFKAIVVS